MPTPITDDTARGILADVPAEFEPDLANVAAGLEGRLTRVGSIYTGLCLFHSCTRSLTKMLCEWFACPMPSLVHSFGVEIDARKREFIRALDDPPRHLFGDAAWMARDRAWCYVDSKPVPVPSCDWLSFGFSCKSLSSANIYSHKYNRALAAGVGSVGAALAGTSGETASHALRYVSRHRPPLVLIENVKGLLAGLYRKNAFTLEVEKDYWSNLMVLLRELKGLGYVTPLSLMDSAQRGGGRRKRAYLPCVLASAATLDGGNADVLSRMIENVMMRLSKGPRTLPWSLSDIFMESDEWIQRACGASCSIELDLTDDRVTKWVAMHRRVFTDAGLHHPPAYPQAFSARMHACGVNPREADIIWYFGMIASLEEELCFDTIIDVSQNLDRLKPQIIMPCILPGARLWWRRHERWVTAPEAIVAQGFDEPRHLAKFGHRLIFDLIGNSFAGSSYTIALACQLLLASRIARAEARDVSHALLEGGEKM